MLIDALETLRALDDEAQLVDGVVLQWRTVDVGVARRVCMTVRGDLVRPVRVIELPALGHVH
jgi:hypothetical protein